MRSAYLIFFISIACLARPLNFDEILKESAKVRKELSTQKSLEQKKSRLKIFEQLFKSNLQAYKTLAPTEGSAEEDRVVKFYISLEPVFELISSDISEDNCRKASHQIHLEDRDATKADTKISKEANESIRLLKTLCPKF